MTLCSESCTACHYRIGWNSHRKMWVDSAGNANTCLSGGTHVGPATNN